jgi:hypothetical protein
MWNVRYLLIAAVCAAMSLSSCTCQKGEPPEVSEKSQEPDLEAKPPALAKDKPTRSKKKPAEEEELVAATPPPLPEDFPKDIPVLEGAKVAQVQNLPNNAHNVIFMTEQGLPGITSFYRKKLEDAGWKVTQNAERGSHAFISFKRGNRIANVQVAEDSRFPGKRVVAIMYEEEKPLPFEDF